MITDDGIIAPDIEITKNRLRVTLAGGGPGLEGLKDRLKELKALIKSSVKAGVGVTHDGHLRVGDIDLTIGEDGDVDIEVESDDLEKLIGDGSEVGANVAKILAWIGAGHDGDEEEAAADGISRRVSCPEGDCATACEKGQTCAASCAGGGCRQTCSDGATCRLTCAGGDCHQRCEGASTCKLTCAGGGCRRACAKDAKCETSCLGDDCSMTQLE